MSRPGNRTNIKEIKFTFMSTQEKAANSHIGEQAGKSAVSRA